MPTYKSSASSDYPQYSSLRTNGHAHHGSESSNYASSGNESDSSYSSDPHDVNIRAPRRRYDLSGSMQQAKFLPPPGLPNDKYKYDSGDDSHDEAMEKVPLTLGENFSYPTR